MKTSGPIKYIHLKSGGYRLISDWWCDTGIEMAAAVVPGWAQLDQSGRLTINDGYQWDGASGPAIDRKANMRAGLAHDALYQLHRAGKLDPSLRNQSDRVFRQMYVTDGGWRWMSWVDYLGLRLFSGYAAARRPETEAAAHTAP